MIVTFTLATLLATKQPQKNLEPTKEVGQTVQIIKPIQSLQLAVPAPAEELPTQAIEPAPVAPTQPIHATSDNLYPVGECTQYVKTRRPDVPNTWGDAWHWWPSAIADGWSVGLIPKAGAIGVSIAGNHVIYVEYVNADGSIHLSERNYDYMGSFRERDSAASLFRYIY